MYKNILKLIPLYIATLCCFIPLNMIYGSNYAWFSHSSIALPALGFHASLVYVILSIITKSLLSYKSLWFMIIKKLPTIMATLALQQKNIMLSVYFPLCMMLLFCIHPVGAVVYIYSWYWFIPVIIYFYIPDTLYSRALSASFIAHATGSVIWLYGKNISVHTWFLLLPVVPIERLYIAGGMVLFIHLFRKISHIQEQQVMA